MLTLVICELTFCSLLPRLYFYISLQRYGLLIGTVESISLFSSTTREQTHNWWDNGPVEGKHQIPYTLEYDFGKKLYNFFPCYLTMHYALVFYIKGHWIAAVFNNDTEDTETILQTYGMRLGKPRACLSQYSYVTSLYT